MLILTLVIFCLVSKVFAGEQNKPTMFNYEEVSKRQEFPYLMSMIVIPHDEEYPVGCVAVVIGQNWAITSKHCLSGTCDIRLLPGENYLVNDLRNIPSYRVNASDVKDGLALLRTEQKFVFSSTLATVKLATSDQTIPGGMKGLTSGYVREENRVQLVSVTLFLYRDRRCNKTMEEKSFDTDSASKICALDAHRSFSFCPSDSGNPLVVRGVLYGINSNVLKRCDVNAMESLFYKIPKYSEWINNITNGGNLTNVCE